MICSLPLSRYKKHNKLIWQATSTEEFPVRSAYYLEMDRNAVECGEWSNKWTYNSLWKKIWNLKIPYTTKVFLWRA